MVSWASAVLTLLSFVKVLLGWLHGRQLIKAGEDAAIARAAGEVLERTQAGKELRERVNMLDESEEDKLWDRLLKPPTGTKP